MKKAFTLAEVLITLGIIGVIAAVIIPTLIANYQKKVLETQYKVAVTTLSQAFGEWAENDDMLRYNNNQWTNIPDRAYSATRAIVNKELMNKYFKGELTWNGINTSKKPNTYTKYNSKSDTTNIVAYYVYTLANGIDILFPLLLTVYANDNKLTSYTYMLFPIYVDINGMDKKPNKIGFDMFSFALTNNGKLIPQGSAQYALFMNKSAQTNEEALSSTYYWRNASKTSVNGCRRTNYTGPGWGCGARIIENGGKIDY